MGHWVSQLLKTKSRVHLQETIQEFPAKDRDTEAVIAKLNLRRTDIATFAAQIVEASWVMMALLGSGVLYLAIPATSNTDFRGLANALTQLRQSAMEAQGNLIIEAAPPELKRHIDIWGDIGDTLGLMKQVKERFDAGSLLNPGRFVSNI